MNKSTAIVIGGTGLVGNELIKVLLASDYYESIIALSRSAVDIVDDRLVQYVIDFDKLSDYKELISASDVFCCIGTTIKVPGQRRNFIRLIINMLMKLQE